METLEWTHKFAVCATKSTSTWSHHAASCNGFLLPQPYENSMVRQKGVCHGPHVGLSRGCPQMLPPSSGPSVLAPPGLSNGVAAS